MKPRHFIIVFLLFLAITLLWIDRAKIINTGKDSEAFWTTHNQRTSQTLAWYDEVVKTLEEELLTRGMTSEEIEKVIAEKAETAEKLHSDMTFLRSGKIILPKS